MTTTSIRQCIRSRYLSLAISVWLVLCLFYYNIFGLIRTFYNTAHHTRYQDYRDPRTRVIVIDKDFLIKTPGCTIPNYSKTFHFKETVPKLLSCGKRAVFLNKISESEIQFYIDEKKMQVYSKKTKYSCCCKFASRSDVPGEEDKLLKYSACTKFQNGTKLYPIEEVIVVDCVTKKNNKTKTIYSDSYMIVKKIKKTTNNYVNQKKWNVLLLGMDTMSRARVYDSMPITTQYMKRNGWLDYRAYHKVGYNTFPNLIPFLTGLKQSNVYDACNHEDARENNLMMWKKYKDQGYVTAFGEENLNCPDTFSSCTRSKRPFKQPPTNHYMRPLFLTGEREFGYLVCTKTMPSAEHLLNFAFDFASTYKDDQFFGLFWMNSFSHGLNRKPPLIDAHVTNFFKRLNETKVLENTIVVFLGDHGIRYGELRYKVEMYYEDRLPMFFMWLPGKFRELYPSAFRNSITNQYRLATPYDLYSTLLDILQLTNSSLEVSKPEGCPLCSSMFEEKSEYRTCVDAGVAEKWCACHVLDPVPVISEHGARQSIASMLEHLNVKLKHTKTINCTKCRGVTLQKVLRVHTYVRDGIKYYIVAILVNPTSLAYEGTILVANDTFTVLDSSRSITNWPKGGLGYCTLDGNDRAHCSCQRIKCKKN